VRHDIRLEGHAFRLRPVEEQDAHYIVALRTQRAQFLNRGATSVAQQHEWLARYFERAGDYYFVVERIDDASPQGLAGIYDVDRTSRSAEWGRWVIEPRSSAAVESALLVYRCAFGPLALASIRCRTLCANAQVVAFHDSCSIPRSDRAVVVERDGKHGAGIEHVLRVDAWPAVEARLDGLAVRAARAAGGTPHALP
jgi:RimJ/RimL family protein N-acetyltransferase